MNTFVLNKLKREWLTEANFELVQKRRRRYLHFDEILEKVSPAVFRKVTNPEFVARHAFFPLIRRSQISRLYKRDPVTGTKKIKEKERPISYAAHFDALVYSWYSCLISFQYEQYLKKEGLGDSVIAYRKLGRSNIDFAKEVFEFVASKDKCAVVAFDIKGFYDNLDPRILKMFWSKILGGKELPLDHYKVFRSVSRHAYVEWAAICKMLNVGEREAEKIRFFLNLNLLQELRAAGEIKVVRDKGIPQGTPISCVLSNLYMLPFDVAVKQGVDAVGGMYRRYSDDIIIVCPLDSLNELEKLVELQISKAKLEIEPAKTERRFFQSLETGLQSCTDPKGKPSKLQYLGVEFDGKSYLLRHKGRAKFERKMIRTVRKEVNKVRGLKIPLRKHKIYERFSPLGGMNYITYARRAARGLDSEQIIQSLSVHKQLKKINVGIAKEKVRAPKKRSKKRTS